MESRWAEAEAGAINFREFEFLSDHVIMWHGWQDYGAEILAESLSSNESITRLNLNSTKIRCDTLPTARARIWELRVSERGRGEKKKKRRRKT